MSIVRCQTVPCSTALDYTVLPSLTFRSMPSTCEKVSSVARLPGWHHGSGGQELVACVRASTLPGRQEREVRS